LSNIDKYIAQLISASPECPIHHAIVYRENFSTGLAYTSTQGFNGPNGGVVQHENVFRTGSITKMFTATLILQLYEEGFLDLHQPIKQLFFNDIKGHIERLERQSTTKKNILVSDLLQHRSGLPDYMNRSQPIFSAFMQKEMASPDHIAELFLRQLPHLINTPSADFHYADTNYLLLGLIAQNTTSTSYADLLQERITRKLHLNSTWMDGELTCPAPLQQYYGNQSIEDTMNWKVDWGGGGILSNAPNLATFMHALHCGQLYQQTKTYQLMTRFLPPENGTLPYGLGIQLFQQKNLQLSGHLSAYGACSFYHIPSSTAIVIQHNQAAATTKTLWLLKKIALETLL